MNLERKVQQSNKSFIISTAAKYRKISQPHAHDASYMQYTIAQK